MVNKSLVIISTTLLVTLINTFGISETIGQENDFDEGDFLKTMNNTSFNREWPNIHPNVPSEFADNVLMPKINETAFIHPFAIVVGDCHIGKMVYMAPTAVCRGDEGTPISIGGYSNIQDGVVLHALETHEGEHQIDGRVFSIDGERLNANDTKFDSGYSVFVGNRTSLAHGANVHGPVWIGDNTFVGMESTIFNAKIGHNVSIGISSTITDGVEIPDNKYVPPGSVITTQEQANSLPLRIGSPYEKTNDAVINVNNVFAMEYPFECIQADVHSREVCMEKDMISSHSP